MAATIVLKSQVDIELLDQVLKEQGHPAGLTQRWDGEEALVESLHEDITERILYDAVAVAAKRKNPRVAQSQRRKVLLAKPQWGEEDRDEAIRMLLERME